MSIFAYSYLAARIFYWVFCSFVAQILQKKNQPAAGWFFFIIFLGYLFGTV
jgi:hypothetical protein